MNRYEHCCSFNVLEGLETEATFTSSEISDVYLEGVVQSVGLNTSVSFNSFDRFVESTSRKDTLHDTIKIIIQNETIVPEKPDEDESTEVAVNMDVSSRGIFFRFE